MLNTNASRLAAETSVITTNEDASNLLNILPFVLSVENGNLLPLPAKHSLCLTCKTAKRAVDLYLTACKLVNASSVLRNDDQIRTLVCSPISRAAKRLECCNDWLSVYDMMRLCTIPFQNLDDVKIMIDGRALDLVSCRPWHKLLKLSLNVQWHCNLTSRAELSEYWTSFSKSKWPLLESLDLYIWPGDYMQGDSDSDDSSQHDQGPEPDIGAAACLLSYFPKLKSLKILNDLCLNDLKAFTVIPHSNIERLDIDCLGDPLPLLGKAKWPRLQELDLMPCAISKNAITEFLKAPWILNLRKLSMRLSPRGARLSLEAAKKLINGLQNGAIESLMFVGCTNDVFLAFEDAELPNLKMLNAFLEYPEMSEGRNRAVKAFNKGLSCFFSTAKLPCLESLTISEFTNRREDGTSSPDIWNVAPACAQEMEANPFSIFPSLKFLRLSQIGIDKDCAKFLASGFYKRGCEIDLKGVQFHSGLDLQKLTQILIFYNINRQEFDNQLSALGLFEKVYWYNLISMDELNMLISSLYLHKFALDLQHTFTPALVAFESAPEVASSVEMNELIQHNLRETQKAVANFTGHCADLEKTRLDHIGNFRPS